MPLRTQSSVTIFTWERDHWPDCSLPLLTLLFLHQVASISSLPLFFSTQLGESLCVFQAVENTQGTDYWLDLSLSFDSPFYPPGHLCLLPPSSLLFSSLCNSVNTSEGSRLWRAHREVITGSLSLSPFDSSTSPGHVYLPSPSSLLHVPLCTSLGVPHWGETFHH